MAYQVKSKPSQVAGRLSHHSLIKLLVCNLLQRKGKDCNFFLFWNDFQTEVQASGRKSSHSRKSSTLRSGKRRGSDISPTPVNQPSFSPKSGKAKKKLDFIHEKEEVSEIPVNKNILNLPYSYSEDEEQQLEIGHEGSVTTGRDHSVFVDIYIVSYENIPSPTPQEEQYHQVVEASSSKKEK